MDSPLYRDPATLPPIALESLRRMDVADLDEKTTAKILDYACIVTNAAMHYFTAINPDYDEDELHAVIHGAIAATVCECIAEGIIRPRRAKTKSRSRKELAVAK